MKHSFVPPCLRAFVPVLLAILAALVLPATTARGQDARDHEGFHSVWHLSQDRPWVGRNFWANRLQDWHIRDGRLECIETRRLSLRTVHLLTHRVGPDPRQIRITVTTGPIDADAATSTDALAGLLFGVGGETMHPAAASIVHGISGPGAGLLAGLDRAGNLVLLDNERALGDPRREMARTALDFTKGWPDEGVRLEIRGLHRAGRPMFGINLRAVHPIRGLLGELDTVVRTSRVAGNVALVSHPGTEATGERSGRFWFDDWVVAGTGLDVDHERVLGPIVSAQHTLSRGVMTMTAQLVPLGPGDERVAVLETRDGEQWQRTAEAIVARPSFTATFRVKGWDDTRDHDYRIVYRLRNRSGTFRLGDWEGTVRKNPIDEPEIVLAGLSCNHNNSHDLRGGWGATDPGRKGDWAAGMWFPHHDLVERLRAHDPDVLFFAGDQIYEGASPTFADRQKIELDYLYKWFLWCWAYRDLTREIPTIAIPDDHDVYQGNLWGHGGRKAGRDNQGGYVHDAEFVRMVERTQTSNLPPPFDAAPVDQGIGVYFTAVNYGRVSFAVIEDRKFKSGCADDRLPPSGTRRPDHFNDPAFDTSRLDVPGLTLLGERQLAFLEAWAADWRTSDLKVALSQTVFANMATHHGKGLTPLIADLDSNGWPQSGRNRALDRLRKAFAVHVAGDQHLTTLVQHGIDGHGDAIWGFCVPAVANFYPRKWLPDAEGENRPAGAPAWLGEHRDGFGNRVTVHAVANPRDMGREPKALHDGMAGYGIIRLDKPNRRITFESWPRFADPSSPSQQYEGWPVTVEQADNDGRAPTGWLAEMRVTGLDDPVVRVFDETTDGLVYALRLKTTGDLTAFRPPVYGPGPFRVEVGCPDRDTWKTLESQSPQDAEVETFVEVPF